MRYWLDAVDEHSLHSPFFFDLYTHVLRPGSASTAPYQGIEQLRQKLLQDQRTIPRSTFGAGSAALAETLPSIASIARTSLSPARYLACYARLIEHLRLQSVVELGTSLGISGLYLAHTPGTTVTTFEGSPEIADTARSTFEFLGAQNIKLLEGNIDTTLPAWLQGIRTLDVAFVDANHRYDATLRYFQWLLPRFHARSVVIFDDIHHSAEMEKAWHNIRTNKLVYGSVDLYRCGMVFFDPSLNRQHHVVQF